MGSGVLPLALDCSRSLVANDALWLRPPAGPSGPGGANSGARAWEGPSDDEVASAVDPRRIWKRVRKHAAQGVPLAELWRCFYSGVQGVPWSPRWGLPQASRNGRQVWQASQFPYPCMPWSP